MRKLQNTWILCFGCLVALVEAGYILPPKLQPFVALLLTIPVWMFGTYNVQHREVNCSLMTHYTVYTLAISAVVMFFFNFLGTKMAESLWPTLTIIDIKYVTTLVVFPVASVAFGIAILRRGSSEYCRACRAKAGFSLHDALERNVFHNESKLQIIIAFCLSLVLSVIGWLYFKLFYINVNFNSPDTFYFFGVPFLVYLVSVGYFVSREWNMRFELKMTIRQHIEGMHTVVRFMVVRDDKLLLSEVSVGDGQHTGLWDTPATMELPLHERVEVDEARAMFATLAGTDDFDIRFLFNNNTYNDNSFHFAVFLHEGCEPEGLPGEWLTLYDVDHMLKNGLINRPFAVEMHRIYTITMAWKTYDRQGRRLYPIKRYRPTFRLVDFPNWDVDYNDLSWVNVSKNNEDRPFFKLRHLWRRYVSGIENKWRRIR